MSSGIYMIKYVCFKYLMELVRYEKYMLDTFTCMQIYC